MYFKTVEGFLESAPQLLLQLSLVLRGSWSRSSSYVIDPELITEIEDEDPDVQVQALNVTSGTDLEVFGRVYNRGEWNCFFTWGFQPQVLGDLKPLLGGQLYCFTQLV